MDVHTCTIHGSYEYKKPCDIHLGYFLPYEQVSTGVWWTVFLMFHISRHSAPVKKTWHQSGSNAMRSWRAKRGRINADVLRSFSKTGLSSMEIRILWKYGNGVGSLYERGSHYWGSLGKSLISFWVWGCLLWNHDLKHRSNLKVIHSAVFSQDYSVYHIS